MTCFVGCYTDETHLEGIHVVDVDPERGALERVSAVRLPNAIGCRSWARLHCRLPGGPPICDFAERRRGTTSGLSSKRKIRLSRVGTWKSDVGLSSECDGRLEGAPLAVPRPMVKKLLTVKERDAASFTGKLAVTHVNGLKVRLLEPVSDDGLTTYSALILAPGFVLNIR